MSTMRLRSLRIEQFKRFRAPLVIEGLADGINLFAAPNEAGKSTVAEAIRAAFFERHRSISVDHLRPWGDGSATPQVELEFDIGPQRYRLSKAFLGKKRCVLQIGSQTLDGMAAEDHLAELLGFRFAGKGASAPEHMGIPGLLWIRQGDTRTLGDAVRHAADHLRQVLGESMGELAASSGDALLRAVETARNELLTPAAGNAKGALADALQRRAELDAEILALDRDIAAYQDSVDRLAALQAEHADELRQRPWAALREQHRQAQARWDAAQGLASRQATELASLRQWRAQGQSLRAQREAFDRDAAAVAARGQAADAAAKAEAAAQAEADAWGRRHRDAELADAAARAQLAQVQARAEHADRARQADELAGSLQAMAQTLQRAATERQRLVQLQAEAAQLAVPAGELKLLRQRTEALRELDLRLDAVATTLRFDLLPGARLNVAGQPVQGQQRRTVLGRTLIDIDGVGRSEVQPGGADLDTLTKQRDQLASEQQALLKRLAVAHLAEAEERARQAAQRQQAALSAQQLLDALAPKGVDALDAEFTQRTSRLAELRAALTALPPAESGDAAMPDRPTAEAEAARARVALDQALAALNAARLGLARAQSAHTGARQELAAAQATLDDAARADRLAALQRALSDALDHEAAAQQRADATDAELKGLNLALLKQDVERLAASAQQLEAAHERRQQDITRLAVTLETKGALGLEEQRAERQREREDQARRAEQLQRRAAALDHLLTLLRAQRSALAQRLRAPLQQHLNHYLQMLFPGARIEVADDLSPGDITRDGPAGAERGGFDALSMGTQEQMGIVARLAYADLLQAAGRPTLLMLDDALVHTDDERLGRMKRVLYDAASRHQLLIFTCHPAAWRDLGVAPRPLVA